jgi:hypothetical protein
MITRLVRAGSIFALVVALSAPAFAYDILLNTDFQDGTAHWKDDPNATACLNAQATSSGVMVPLSSNGWSKISQTFDTPDAALELDVTYGFSDDWSFAPGAVFDSSVVQQLTGVNVEFFFPAVEVQRMGGHDRRSAGPHHSLHQDLQQLA